MLRLLLMQRVSQISARHCSASMGPSTLARRHYWLQWVPSMELLMEKYNVSTNLLQPIIYKTSMRVIQGCTCLKFKSKLKCTTTLFWKYKLSIFIYIFTQYPSYFKIVLELNISKLTSVLCQSSRVFVPVDDPIQEVFDTAAEVDNFWKWTKICRYTEIDY